MAKGKLRHIFEFALIFLVLIVSISLMEFFRNTWIRLAIITFTSIFYVGAGIFHHWEEKNLNSKQVFEYLALGLLMFLILQAVYK